MKILKDSVNDFFKWVKGTELVELDDIDVSEDPVRPELTLGFRIQHGRKIFGLKYENEIEAIICVAFCPEVPYTVREMDYMSRVKDGKCAIAYTVWSRKRGAGREIVRKLGEWSKKNNVSISTNADKHLDEILGFLTYGKTWRNVNVNMRN